MIAGWYNPYLVVPFVSWLIAQTFKVIRSGLHGKLDLRYFYLSGEMPSAHTAAVCSLAITALILNGFTSAFFGVTGVFAAVVIYDSFGVRRATGDQAIAINAILKSLKNLKNQPEDNVKIREVLGHTPAEVIAGGALGTLVAVAMNYSQVF